MYNFNVKKHNIFLALFVGVYLYCHFYLKRLALAPVFLRSSEKAHSAFGLLERYCGNTYYILFSDSGSPQKLTRLSYFTVCYAMKK